MASERASSRTAGASPASQNAGPLFSTPVNATSIATTTSTTPGISTSLTPEASNAPYRPSLERTSGIRRSESRSRPPASDGKASRTRPSSSFSTVFPVCSVSAVFSVSSVSSASASTSPLQPLGQPLPPFPGPPALPPKPSGSSGRHRPSVLVKEPRPPIGRKSSLTRLRSFTSATATNDSGEARTRGVYSHLYHQRHKSTSSVSFNSAPKGSTGNANSKTKDELPPLPSDWAAATASAARSTSPNSRRAVPRVVVLSPLDTQPSLATAATIVPATPHLTARSTPNFSHPSHVPASSTLATPSATNKMLASVIQPPSSAGLGLGLAVGNGSSVVSQSEGASLLQHIQDLVNKRISTLDYLRKA